ncbi:MAG: hypothetical protein NC937_03515 [Candidatus Omnitrophica bacterium]|nr:hypothetical protein [Candidatus Omnitrophota bacterium]
MKKYFTAAFVIFTVLLFYGCATHQKKEMTGEKKTTSETSRVMITTGTRTLPDFCKPGGIVKVKIDVVPASQISGVIVAEKLPDGWEIVKSEPPISRIEPENTYKWLQWAQQVLPFSIMYDVRVPENAKGIYKFEGKITTYREGDIPIIGKSEIKVK